MPELIAVYTTVATREDARRIARELVGRKLAACAQITEIESFYAWKGELVNEPEYRVLIKTTAARYVDVERAIRGIHPYELPAIHAVEIALVYEPYGEWVEENSSGVGASANDSRQGRGH
jgi:periplasmic divalent cation tolerance protein